MKTHILTSALAVALLTACPDSGKKPTKAAGRPSETSLPGRSPSEDVGFQSFVGRLREAVEGRDLPALASMMTEDFGYRWDTAPADETPFSYWNDNNLWPQLRALVSQRWVQHDGFMVVPPQLATDTNYNGYRAGISQVGGSWRFAYFVPAPAKQ
jgi:hypothetical protein